MNLQEQISRMKSIMGLIKENLTFYHGGLSPDATLSDIDVFRLSSRQQKRGRDYAGFYMSPDIEADSFALQYHKSNEGSGLHKITLPSDAKAYEYSSPMERITRTELIDLFEKGYDYISGKNLFGNPEYILLNKNIADLELVSNDTGDDETSYRLDIDSNNDETNNFNQPIQEHISRMKSIMGLLIESTSEEAWELVGQEEPTIRNLMNDKGYSYDEESVEKLIPIIDNLPTIEVTYDQIKDFNNLENRESDKGLVEKMYEISSTENPRKGYRDYMMRRDKSEKRQRGYDPVMNFDRIISGDYENPLVLYIDDSYYVIGGRTRLYASIAANSPIKIKIIQPSDL